MKHYYIGSCLICGQGMLESVKEDNSNNLCVECEAEWNSSEDALNEHNCIMSIYRTDEEGRIFRVRVEELHLTERTERLPHDPRTFGKLEDDDAGHLIGDRFGGSPKLDNLVSQAQKVNRSEYKVIEDIWAKALKEGKKVSVDIEVHYADGGARPTGFTVQYAIDGKWKKQTIENKIERKRK